MMKRGFGVAGVLALCLLVVLSVIPGHMQIRTEAPKGLEHFAAYLLAGFVLVRAFGAYVRAPIMVAILVVLSGVLEAAQLWVPGRTCSVEDWGASALGAMLGVCCALLWSRTISGREAPEASRHA
jgi:VanZ family protein